VEGCYGAAKGGSSTYDVEGCYSEFKSIFEKDMGDDNSNILCQNVCREQGFALAATHNGHICQCGNIYPTEKNVSDDKCTSQCVSYLDCSSPQQCCGGVDSYTVSMVGDLDNTLQVLRRLSYAWLNNEAYRTNMIDHMKDNSDPNTIAPPTRYLMSWNEDPNNFNKAGLASCGENEYMTGMHRSGLGHPDTIYRIEDAECSLSDVKVAYPRESDCYEQDWEYDYDFNRQGWAKCKDGYYMSGLNRSDQKDPLLHNIESAKCCKPQNAEEKWGNCKEKDVRDTFNSESKQSCDDNYFMAGLYRSACDELFCLEMFWCCEMGGPIDGTNSWMENPYLTLNILSATSTLQRCSMRAMDTTANSESYKCQNLTNEDNILVLDATSFDIQDETPLNEAKPEPIPGLRPVQCVPSQKPYQCKKELDTTITQSSTFTIGTGFETSVSIDSGVEVESKFFGSGITTSFQEEVSASSSFNTESSRTTETTTTDSTTVTVDVPVNTQITINMLRSTENIQYRWKGNFEVIGPYFADWDNGYEYMQDITTALTGDDLSICSFGLWKYPSTDTLKVIVTDEYGSELAEGCDQSVGQSGDDCTIDATEKVGSKSNVSKEEL